MFFDQFFKPEPLIKLAQQNQPAACRRQVRSDLGTPAYSSRLEINLEGSVERERKGPILYLTRWVLISGARSSRSQPHEY